MSIGSVDSAPLHVKQEADLNLSTEANRVLYVMNKLIQRAKFAGLLKYFVQNDGHLLKDILNPTTHFQVVQACFKFQYEIQDNASTSGTSNGSEKSSTRVSKKSVQDKESYEDSESDVISSAPTLKGRFDNNLYQRHDKSICKVICILEENEQVQERAKEMENKLSPEMKFFIKSLIEFKNRKEIHLNQNASQQKKRERYLRQTYDRNERIKKEIERLEEELVVTKTDANVCLIGRNILINRHQHKIEKLQQSSLESIEKRVKESEKAMVNDWKTSQANQEKLKEEFQNTTERYENLLKEHLTAEKTMRAKRTKVENQVLGWIQKFDQDIGEKQTEAEEIQALLDEETKAVNEIQEKLDEQEEEYDELMQQKAEFEEEMLERRLYQFIMNRSARRIQRTYRLYKARKLARKLAKKSKKGKKKGKE